MNDIKHMQQGTRVQTPYGPGTVAYVRNGPPTYSQPEAVSVVLDSQRARPGYAGTLVAAADVAVLP